MKIKMIAVVGGIALLAAACSDPAPEVDRDPPAAVVVPPAEPAPAPEPTPVETPSPTDATPVDTSALPPDQRSSEETVQPESETLFY